MYPKPNKIYVAVFTDELSGAIVKHIESKGLISGPEFNQLTNEDIKTLVGKIHYKILVSMGRETNE